MAEEDYTVDDLAEQYPASSSYAKGVQPVDYGSDEGGVSYRPQGYTSTEEYQPPSGPPEFISVEDMNRSMTRVPGRRAGGMPEFLTPDEMDQSITSSQSGAALRGVAEGALPGVAGGAGGILTGAATGAALGAAGAHPFTIGAGALIGGVLGGFGIGYGAHKAQEWGLEASGLRDTPGGVFSREQMAADLAINPYSRWGGQMAPGLMFMRPNVSGITRNPATW